jgi:hypothetical protein
MCDNPGWGDCDTMVRFVNSRNRRGTYGRSLVRSSDLARALQLPIEIWRAPCQVRAVYVIQPTEAACPLATLTVSFRGTSECDTCTSISRAGLCSRGTCRYVNNEMPIRLKRGTTLRINHSLRIRF